MRSIQFYLSSQIKFILNILLQLILGFLSTVILYKAFVMILEIAAPYPHDVKSGIQLILMIVMILLSLFVSETTLRLSPDKFHKRRWLSILSLVFLTVSCLSAVFMAMSNKHIYDYFKLILLISYFLITLWYLIRFQWKFIPQGNNYDLLLGLVYLWYLITIIIDARYDDMTGPPEQMDEVADRIAMYFLPILLIVPGLFPKEKMKYAVWFSLITFPLCVGIIGNIGLMGLLVDHRRDVTLLTGIGFSLLSGVILFAVFLIPAYAGRVCYFGYNCIKNRKK